jgi:predicted small secreted protein
MKYKWMICLPLCLLMLSACGETIQGLKNDMSRLGQAVGETGKSMTASLAARDDNSALACPEVIVLPTHDRLYEFTDPDDPDMREMISAFYLVQTQIECVPENDMMSLAINLYFEGKTGPKAKRKEADKPFFSYPYFIAVRDKDDQELAREIFAVSPTYETDETKIQMVETIRQSLPLEKAYMPYRVEIGFAVDDDQLFFNTATPENSRFTSPVRELAVDESAQKETIVIETENENG